MKIKIITPYYDVYLINEKGEISTKKTNWEFSGQWTILGIESVKSNFFIPFKDITEENLKSLQLLYKNGHPKFTVRDLDHNTTRTWGNTIWHGIKHISFLP